MDVELMEQHHSAPERNPEETIALLTEQLAERDRALLMAAERLQKFESRHEKDTQLIKELTEAATRDPLTGLYNRRGARDQINHVLEKHRGSVEPSKERRAKKRDIAVLALDIDNFKLVNDTYGHAAGDTVLVEVAQRLQACFRRPDDLVARTGGEEITVILPGADAQDAYNLLFRRFGNEKHTFRSGESPSIGFLIDIRDKAGKSVTLEITLSGGIANFEEGSSLEETEAIADTALYRAKKTGKNRILISGPEDRAQSEDDREDNKETK